MIDAEWDQPDVWLSPGTYCGKFTLKNATHAHLAPGMYIMAGGPMNIEGDSILEGENVTFYFTEWNGDFEPFSIQSNAQVILNAPTDCGGLGPPPSFCANPWYGILFYVDPAAGTRMTSSVSRATPASTTWTAPCTCRTTSSMSKARA